MQGPIATIHDLIVRLDQVDVRVEEYSRRMSLAHFNQLTGQPFEDMAVLNAALGETMLDESIRAAVDDWLPKVTDQRLHRRLTMCARSFLQAHVTYDDTLFTQTQRIEERIIGFQPTIDGRTVSRGERNRILESDPDRTARQAAYSAGKVLDEMIEADLLELMAARNRLARTLGYCDYVALGLENQELTEQELRRLFETIREMTEDRWREFLVSAARELGVDRLMPWDIAYCLEYVLPSPPSHRFPKDRIVPVFKEALAACGGDLDVLPIEVVVQDIPYGGLCIPIRYNHDIRILSNPRDGFMSYDTLFHEFGHGIQAAGLDASSFLVAQADPPFFWEGIAGIYEHLMQTETVLIHLLRMTPVDVDNIRRRSQLFRINWFRSIAVACELEWAAYRGESDLRGCLRDLYEKYMGVSMPQDVGWAGNTLYTTHPLYNQNYLMMEVMALQTIEAMQSRLGHYPHPGMFAFLQEGYIGPAGWIPWREKIRHMTGHPLTADALGRYLSQ
ncbi:hypothetical protein JXA80_03685 [bacterium]|nr:hypothetical protein [candidate division CSSED10-310 bacterium]